MSTDFIPQPADRMWIKQAACRAEDVDPEIFFPDNNVAGIAKARAICATCPVVRACLADCLRQEGGRVAATRFGIYGGLSPRQRVRLYERLRHRAQQKARAAA